jgi:dihydroorotase-like cyclic amidohydrolase
MSLIEPGVIDWPRMVAMLTINPARLCRLDRPDLAAMGVPSEKALAPRHAAAAASSGASPTPGGAGGVGSTRPGLGTLAVGAPADITLIDPRAEWTYSVAASRSRSHNSPYDGVTLRGRAAMTIVAGVVRHESPRG